MTKLFAHRGATQFETENTLSAFEYALDLGTDGIELDVHLSSDGEIVVFHDFNLDRLTEGRGAVSSFTSYDLQSLVFKSGKSYDQIPLLSDVLNLIKTHDQTHGSHTLLNCELKAGSDLYPGIEKAVVDLCLSYLSPDQIIVSSFDHYSLRRVKNYESSIKTGILTAAAIIDPWNYVSALKGDFYHPNVMTLTKPSLDAFKKYGCPITPYTVNNVKQAYLLFENGVYGLITDLLEDMLEIRPSY